MRTLVVAIAGLAALVLTLSAPADAAPPVPKVPAYVHPAVTAALARDDRAEVIVTLRDAAGDEASLARMERSVAAAQDGVLDAMPPGSFAVLSRPAAIPVLAGSLRSAGLAPLLSHPRVLSVEPDRWLRPALAESLPTLGVDRMRERYGLTGAGVGVAVLDTGIDPTHPDVAEALVAQQCFSSGTRSCAPTGLPKSPDATDEHGHGTAVSGIILSRGEVAPEGVAPGADLIAVRVFRDRGGAPTRDIVDGLDWVLRNQGPLNIRVVNMSLGGGGSFGVNCDNEAASMKSAFQRLTNRGVSIFVATGNNGFPSQVSFPACVSNSTAVGATFDTDYASAPGCPGQGAVDHRTITCFTNRGRAMDLLAPGSMITTSRMGGGTTTGAGTSYAAPMAAGVAALLYEADPDLRPLDVERILKQTGRTVEHPDNDDTFPLVDALAAVEAVLPATPTPEATATPAPSATPTPAPPTATSAPSATPDATPAATEPATPAPSPTPAATDDGPAAAIYLPSLKNEP